MSQKELADWYLRKGYKWKPVITGEMEKTLTQIP